MSYKPVKPVAKASVSLAHTYGNVLSVFTEYIKGLMPEDYFRTVHVTTKLPFKDFDRYKNKNAEFIKKRKPMLIIRPRILLDDSDKFLHGSYLTTRVFDDEDAQNFGELQPFILDQSTNVHMKYLMNRLSMELDVTIVVETQMEQINVAHYLQNTIRQNRAFMIPTALESNVSKDMLNIFAKEVGVPMYDENNSVKNFLDFINSKSNYPMTYKMQNSSGNDEFFRYYPCNVDVEIRDMQIDDPARKNMVNGTATINFNMRLEFNAAAMYFIYSEKPKNIAYSNLGIVSGETYLPMFTIQSANDLIDIPAGWSMYTNTIFKLDQDSDTPIEEDVTDLRPLFNSSTLSTIDYVIETGTPSYTLINVVIFKDADQLVENIDYVVDWKSLEMRLTNCNLSSTYRLIIYINGKYVNEIVSDMIETDSEKPSFIRSPKVGNDDPLCIKPFPKNMPVFMGNYGYNTLSPALLKKLPTSFIEKTPARLDYDNVLTNQYVIIAIPNKFKVGAIEDANGRDITSTFKTAERPLILAAWGNGIYNIYISKTKFTGRTQRTVIITGLQEE